MYLAFVERTGQRLFHCIYLYVIASDDNRINTKSVPFTTCFTVVFSFWASSKGMESLLLISQWWELDFALYIDYIFIRRTDGRSFSLG